MRPSRFEGTIGRTVAESTPFYDEAPHPGDDAPNVVVVLLDDTGFAQFGCYGSDIDTPNIDALAAGGLQFTNFHVTPLCSPTRASLLTGRSQHAVGMRAVSNFRTGFPNMLGHISNHAATMAEVLRDAGYATFAVGKWHLAPMEQCSAAGPFDQWPLARGFDRFYGFMEGETDQFHPELVADNHPITPPAGPDEGYHLSEDLVDQALRMISDSVGVRPDRPFFTYLAFGATHAPHQAPPEYLAKYRGRFDEGWDVVRERWFERQLELGVIPAGTEARAAQSRRRRVGRPAREPAAPGVPSPGGVRRVPRPHRRADRPPRRRAAPSRPARQHGARRARRQRRVAGGRPVRCHARDEVLQRHLRDARRGRRAHRRHRRPAQPHQLSVGLGAVRQHPVQVVQAEHPRGWRPRADGRALARADRRRHGGTRARPVHVRRRHRTDDLRADRRHTARGVPRRRAAAGHRPLVRRARSTDAAAPATNQLQYFEMGGSRALVAGEWKAVCKHDQGADYDTEPWELYHLSTDFSECRDLAAERARTARRAAGSVVAGGGTPRRAAARRPDVRAVRRPLPRPLAAPGRPSLRVPTADVAAARPGRCGDRWAQLRPHRPPHAGSRATTACCTRPAPRTAGCRCSCRTTAWWSTTTRSTITPSSSPLSHCRKEM